jgi:hypothetical protein
MWADISFTLSAVLSVFNSSPTQRFLPVGECAHLNRFAVADCVDIRKAHIRPFIAALVSKLSVNEHHDPVPRSDKALGLAASLGPVGSRLRQIVLNAIPPVIRATAGKFGRFGPLDLGVERFYRRVYVASVECRVRAPKGGNGLRHLGRGFHVSLVPFPGTSAQTERRGNDNRRQ